jgi:hypothetical protein
MGGSGSILRTAFAQRLRLLIKQAAFPRIQTMKFSCGIARWNGIFVCAARLIAITIFVHAWYESHQGAWLFGAGSCGYFFIESLAKALLKLRRQ